MEKNDKKMMAVVRGAGIAAVFVVAASFAVPTVRAAYFGTGRNVTLDAPAVVDQNVYAAGTDVSVSAPVTGDVFAAGDVVYISSRVTGDIMALGSTVMIQGAEAQDVRVAAANLTVGGAFSGELLAAGASVTVTPGTTIAKDSYIAASDLSFDGDASGTLYVMGGTVYFDGTTRGNLVIKNAKEVTIGPDAMIGGNLEYTAPRAASIAQRARIGGTTLFHQAQTRDAHNAWAPFLAILTLWWLVKLAIILAGAYLLWYAFKKDVTSIASRVVNGFWKELLRGFLVAVALPIASVIAIFTVIGALPGVVALFAYAAVMIAAVPMAGIVSATIIWSRRKEALRWYHILLGTIALPIVALVPFVGWIVACAVYLASFGALTLFLSERIMKRS